MSSICYAGPFTDATGYGEATRNFCMALVRASVNLTTKNTPFTLKEFDAGIPTKVCKELQDKHKDYKIKIIHTTPDVYKNYMEPGKYHIGHLFWETNLLPKGWADACNRMNEIWTGTPQAETMLRNSGVKVPITIFPEPIEVDVPKSRPFILPNFKGMVFYSIIDWKERKNPRKLLLSYWKEFRGVTDVALLIKVGAGDHNRAQEIIGAMRDMKSKLGFDDTPRTMVVTKLLTTEDKHRFHETGVAFVSAHRGEGWGLAQVEAVLHSKIVISTAIGGIHDLWKSRHYRGVKFDLLPIEETVDKYYEKNMLWAEVNEDDLREKMRKTYELWREPKTRNLLALPPSIAKNMVRNELNYHTVGTAMKGRLEAIEETL